MAYITSEVLQQTSLFGAELSQAAGSGFVWDASGHVITNNHVVEGARRLFVQLDAGQPIEARLVGRSPEYDLAVLQLARVPRDLKPIPLGSSKDLRIGQTTCAIGNPFGLSRTLTQGLISALDRELPTTGFRGVPCVIQTDATTTPPLSYSAADECAHTVSRSRRRRCRCGGALPRAQRSKRTPVQCRR